MKKKKVFLVILLGLIGSLFPLAFPAPNYWFCILGGAVGLIVGWVGIGCLAITPKTIPTSAPASPRKTAPIILSEIEIIDLKEVTETESLSGVETSIILVPKVLSTESYVGLFDSWNNGNHLFPGIDHLFEELLEEDDSEGEVIVRTFATKKSEYDPFSYFHSLRNYPQDYSLSARMIMQYFIEYRSLLGSRNWFVLNTKPGEGAVRVDDLRIVDIKRLNNNKYFLYCYPYDHWSTFGGGWMSAPKNMRFVISIP